MPNGIGYVPFSQINGVKTDYDYDYDGLNRLVKETVEQSDGDKLFEQDYALLANGQRDYVIEKRYDNSGGGSFGTTKIDWDYGAIVATTR